MVKPKNEFKVLIVYPNLPLMLVPSIAVALFNRILKSNGYQVSLFDTTEYVEEASSSPQNRAKFLQTRPFSDEDDLGVSVKTDLLGDFDQKVSEIKPDLMIFSVVEDVFPKTVSMLERVKEQNIPHLLGGVFPTAAPEICFKSSVVNMIGVGEGEETIVKVAEALRLNEPLHEIPGVWVRGEKGTIQKNPPPPVVNISSNTPDFGLFAEKRFFRPMGGHIFKTIPLETYRGCPFRCTYCNSPMQVKLSRENKAGNYLRRKSMKFLREEISGLVEQLQPEFFFIVDDTFLARPKEEIYEFCDMYEEFKIPFFFNARPETCLPETLKRLKEVGAYRISCALECGNEDYRTKVLKRNGTNAQIISWFNKLADSQIPHTKNLIIGFPGETREMVMETVELVKLIGGYDSLTVSIFTPYHGTELREVALKNKWLNPNKNTPSITTSSILKMPPPYLSSEDISGLIRVIPLYCYFPKSEWEQIRRAETDDDLGNETLEHYSKIYREEFLKQSQQESMQHKVVGGNGCRSNEKDSIRIDQRHFRKEEIDMLTT